MYFSELQQTCEILIKLHIVFDHGSSAYTLDPTFRNQLALAIYGSKYVILYV